MKLDGLAEEMRNDPNIGLTLRLLLVENLELISVDPRLKLVGLIVFSIVKVAIQNLMIPQQIPAKTEDIKTKYGDI